MSLITTRNALLALGFIFMFVKIFQLLGVDIQHITLYISFIVFLVISTMVLPIKDLSLND